MISRPALAICLTIGAMAAFSALAQPARTTDLPDKMAGVYKSHFQNGLVSGESYTSENILEIVPYKAGAAYFRIHLEFFNGHECAMSGIAEARVDRLVYVGPKDDDGAPCTLTIRHAANGVHIYENENGACRNQTCGERGGYGYKPNGPADFKPADRRPIRYLPRLLASREYADAAKEYEARGR